MSTEAPLDTVPARNLSGLTQEFAGLVAAVTGGAAGIGLAIARRLQAAGANVAVLDLATAPEDFFSVATDIGDSASVDAAIAAVVAKFGRLDIVINNAGIGAVGSADSHTDEEIARVLNINVAGIMRTTRAALPHLLKSEHAAIVNTSSIGATAGLPARALYSASKGAVSALTRHMAADYIAQGIRVNAVNPGTTNTEWVGRLLDQSEDPTAERMALNARQPHGRLVEPSEVADAVAYLASPRSASTVGIELAVDGGMQNLRLRPRS